jgi:hypothetical protein
MTKRSPKNLLDPSSHFNEIERALAKFDMTWACAALALRGGPRFKAAGGLRAQSLSKVYEHFEHLREAVEAGERALVLRAIEDAIIEGLPVPTWLGSAFRSLLREHYDGKTLDEAFGAPPSTGARGKAVRTDWKWQGRLWRAVCKAIDDGAPSLDAALGPAMEEVGFPFAKRKARELVLVQNEIQERSRLGLSRYGGRFSYLSRNSGKG